MAASFYEFRVPPGQKIYFSNTGLPDSWEQVESIPLTAGESLKVEMEGLTETVYNEIKNRAQRDGYKFGGV